MLPLVATVSTASVAAPWWLQLLDRYGLQTLALVAGSIFAAKIMWPWFTSQLDKLQAARERDLDRFNAQLTEISKGTATALEKLTERIESWRK